MCPAPSLKAAGWLADPDLRAVLDALEAEGGEARVAGGAVRDGLFGHPVNDIDIATTEAPERVIELAGKAGLNTHPTGLQHGTVTVVSNKHAFEVTTLRVDEETFGRHAKVAFTDQWELDARRRDFTINALFCDRDGKVWDYVNGLKDIETQTVRFVGQASERIAEDYLRVLRFFRFYARFGTGVPNEEALAACIAAKDQLRTLSRERIRQELLKLLCAPGAPETLHIMEEHGILEQTVPGVSDVELVSKLILLENALAFSADPLRRLSALAKTATPTQLQVGLVLSNADTKRLEAISALPSITPAFRDAERQTLLYWHGAEAVIDKALLIWAASADSNEDSGWRDLISSAQSWIPPRFPIRGKDLLDAGIAEGQELGRCLQALEDWWVAGGFSADKPALMGRLSAIRR